MSKRYLGRKQLTERYNKSERVIDRMVRDGRLPEPDLYLSRSPRWDEQRLDAADRAAVTRPRGTTAIAKQVEHTTT